MMSMSYLVGAYKTKRSISPCLSPYALDVGRDVSSHGSP